jgi:hypothetical protein
MDEARAERELCVLELQRHKEELAVITSAATIRGPTSKDILKAIQTSVKNPGREDNPLTLKVFADSLRNDERVAQLLQANSEEQKRGAIEAVEALDRAIGSPDETIASSVIIDLFFCPEAETEKLLESMQRTKNRVPSWKLDNKQQNKAMATLESSLQTKLEHYNRLEASFAQDLIKVRKELAERDAEEQQEMELVAALAAAQRERNAVKLQQKKELEKNKVLRKSAPTDAAKDAALNLVNNISTKGQISAVPVAL